MGMNSLLFVPNDNLCLVDKYPEEFAKALSGAINLSCVQPKPTALVGAFGDFSIPYCSHTDNVGIVAVGGNFAEPLLETYKGYSHIHHTKEGQVELLKALAERLGYSVRKKAKKKG